MPNVGPFELRDDIVPLHEPRLLMALRPWIDVGTVGTMALTYLEQSWSGEQVGQLERPGVFYDFSRYRPMLFRREGQRVVTVPNTLLSAAHSPDGASWLLLHAVEPHNNGEDYVDALFALIQHFGVREYTLIGSMYAPVPHTRPPLASGGASNPELMARLRAAGVKESSYEGPTTILATLPMIALEAGVQTATIILQLPAYAQVERDYRGLVAMLEMLGGLYGFSLEMEEVRKEADGQRQLLDSTAQEDERLRSWLAELEALYDAETPKQPGAEEPQVPLSPELEGFLRDIERRWQDGEPRS